MSSSFQADSHFDVVTVMCGGSYEHGGEFHPTTYRHSDEFGMLGGAMRVQAALYMYIHGMCDTLLFSTGVSAKQVEKYGPNVPPESQTYSTFFNGLLARAVAANPRAIEGKSKPKVFEEDRSVNTTWNVRYSLEIIRDQGWENIALISSDYHIPRIHALVDLIMKTDGTGAGLHFTYLSAEDVVQELAPGEFDAEISVAYASAEARKRIANEAQGLRDIAEGRYVLSEYQLHERYRADNFHNGA